MTLHRRFTFGAFLAVMAIVGLAALRARAESAATQPALSISPEARPILNQLRDAYGGLKSLSVTGTIKGDFDIDGAHNTSAARFNGLFAAPGLFRSEMGDTLADEATTAPPAADALIGNTGNKIYLYFPGKNRYEMTDAPAGKIDLDSLGDDVADLLLRQNLPIALALSSDASAEIAQNASSIVRADDVNIQGQAFPAITVSTQVSDVTLVVDPLTHLLRRAVADQSKYARQMGAQQVRSAVLTMDYSNSPGVATDAAAFAWTPPPGAQPASSDNGGGDLEGKPAPAFALTGLDGNQVDSQSLKGAVYVVDFWATWCGPCVASLPHLDAIYKDFKGQGVRFFAIDVQEDRDTIQKFVNDSKLSIPVLMDSDGKVTDRYDTQGGIPFTVVVGKDGTVLKAGFLGGDEDQIRPIIQSALKK